VIYNMGIVYSPKWKPFKERLTASELRAQYIANSHCLVSVVHGEHHPKLLHIEFHGELAKIPSLKNSKLPGMNFVNPDVTARLKAMDELFNREIHEAGYENWSFGIEHIHVTAIFSDRDRAVNEDNLMSAIKDWLEPSTKPVGKSRSNRGWGVGVVQDDYYAHGYPVVGEMLGLHPTHTTIIIRPLSAMREALCNFVAQASLV